MKKKILFLLFSICSLLVNAQLIDINESIEKYPLKLTIKSISYVENNKGKEVTKVNCELENMSTRKMSIALNKDIKLLCDNGQILKIIGTDAIMPNRSYPLNPRESKEYSLYFERIPYDVQTVAYIGGDLRINNIDVLRSKEPPNLYFVENSFIFEDKTGNDAIDADEQCSISFEVINKGKGNAYGCKVITETKGDIQDIYISSTNVSVIKSGERQKITVPIFSGMNTVDGSVAFTINVKEPLGFGTEPRTIEVTTKRFENPFVQVADYNITSDIKGSTTLRKKEQFDLQIVLQNTGVGKAENVVVDLVKPDDVYSSSSETIGNIGYMEPGEIKSLVYTLAIKMDYQGNSVPFKVRVKEKYGKYSQDKDILLNLNQNFANNKIVINEKEKKRINNKNGSLVLNSDVDKDIPINNIINGTTYAIIIANEVYNRIESNVYLAEKDGRAFKEYCTKTLGIPNDENHIIFIKDATLNDMNYAIGRLKELDEVNEINNVIFYYAGHGIPDEQTKEAYLVPVDAYVGNTNTSYNVNKLYSELSSLRAKNVFVFLDACFSGSQRGEGMIASARSVAIAPTKSHLEGNIIVFSASTADQTAMPYMEKEHGLFTYFLLKKLKDSKGKCTLGQLSDYVTKQVELHSVNKIQKRQTPSITSSSIMQNKWRNLKLVK
ncbi:MAG: caspase family protein [Bacteroidales bacterium]|nr:caspase family protein [Bacteroidales bacterium]